VVRQPRDLAGASVTAVSGTWNRSAGGTITSNGGLRSWYDRAGFLRIPAEYTAAPEVSVRIVALTGIASPLPSAGPATAAHIRRCVYRRVAVVRSRSRLVYAVECLRAGSYVPLPLGDLDTAHPVCGSCETPNLFRPDED
jgi:hypothetical protein